MKKILADIKKEADEDLKRARTQEDVSEVKRKYLGRKGPLSLFIKELTGLSPQERRQAGEEINQLKKALSDAIDSLYDEYGKREKKGLLEKERIDVTLPGRPLPIGRLHPITRVMEEVEEIFASMGFTVAEGPQVENDYYNFSALNIPPDHPARDMQDTFYLAGDLLLRTHTSPVQIRVMEKEKPPLRIIAPGAVYRRDSDITHTPMFHQIEGFMVDENVTFADLKGVLTSFLQRLFGSDIGTRFRPSFFPFTEPSAEVDIRCVMCGGLGGKGGRKVASFFSSPPHLNPLPRGERGNSQAIGKGTTSTPSPPLGGEGGAGCRVCKNSGWLEVLGCGMIHPNVFKSVGYDCEKYSGFAFGLGIERIAMLKYGIDDIRLFFENDLRFLRQF